MSVSCSTNELFTKMCTFKNKREQMLGTQRESLTHYQTLGIREFIELYIDDTRIRLWALKNLSDPRMDLPARG